jgi:hypothetical protein
MLRSQSDIYSVPWDRRPSITAAFQLSSFPLLLREGRTGREGCIVEVLPQASQVQSYINFEAEHNGVPHEVGERGGRQDGHALFPWWSIHVKRPANGQPDVAVSAVV